MEEVKGSGGSVTCGEIVNPDQGEGHGRGIVEVQDAGIWSLYLPFRVAVELKSILDFHFGRCFGRCKHRFSVDFSPIINLSLSPVRFQFHSASTELYDSVTLTHSNTQSIPVESSPESRLNPPLEG